MTEPPPNVELAVRAPAKVNLSLEVLGTRPDGYHEIRTVMQAVSLWDDLGFAARSDGQVRLHCRDPELAAEGENLVVRAALSLQQHVGVERGVDIVLRKRIPVGGGLGGGSSDCAVTFLALRRLWGLDIELEELSALAARQGSDAPFFLRGGTALCEGRGERVKPVGCAERIHHVLIMPGYRVSTAEVYRRAGGSLTSCGDASNNVIVAVRTGDVQLLSSAVCNDLQEPALSAYQRLGALWTELEEARALGEVKQVLLSGSGSSFFAVTEGKKAARRAARKLQARLGVSCSVVHSLDAWEGRVSRLTLGR